MVVYTINSDASYSHKYKRGAWAYWIKNDDLNIKKSGMFEQRLHSSFVAELLAFEKAFREIDKLVDPAHRGAVIIYVNTDSQFVIHTLDGTAKIKSARNRALVHSIRHATKEYKVIPRHVKAHTEDLTEARSWINDWCDKAAKGEMGNNIYFERNKYGTKK